MTVFSQLLQLYRSHSGISGREVARRAKIAPTVISQIEHGKYVPSRETLMLIVEVLSLSTIQTNALLDALGYAPINTSNTYELSDDEIAHIKVLRAYPHINSFNHLWRLAPNESDLILYERTKGFSQSLPDNHPYYEWKQEQIDARNKIADVK